MPNFRFSLQLELLINGRAYQLRPLLELLQGIKTSGNLRAAAETCGISYRKAWNLLKEYEQLIGAAFVDMQKGRGSRLTEAGRQLLAVAVRNERKFAVELAAAAERADSQMLELLQQRSDAGSVKQKN